MLFDGKSEAIEQAKVAVAQRIAAIAKNRERLVVPADAAEVGKLASHYVSPHSARCACVRRTVRRSSTLGNGIARSPRARMTTAPPPSSRSTPRSRLNFVVGERDGKRALIIRDAQHEYAFVELASP